MQPFLFSDILGGAYRPCNIPVEMKADGIGPWIPKPIRTAEQLCIKSLSLTATKLHLGLRYRCCKDDQTSARTIEVPLIGFAGSPWTLLCYAVQGQGSKNFDIGKSLLLQSARSWPIALLQKITDTTIALSQSKR